MNLLPLLARQLAEYPLAQPVDLLKLLYQNEFGCGHLIDDPMKSRNRLKEEADRLPAEQDDGPFIERIGNGLCRIHLRVLHRERLRLNTLHRFFELSAVRLRGSRDGFLGKAAVLEQLCRDGALPFDAEEVRRQIEVWKTGKGRPFRHSAQFRAAYAPAYRVVEQPFCDYLQLFCRIDSLLTEKGRVLVAIDGNCASGKTTLAALLQLVYGCNILPMDHFFLRPEQRTAERLAEPGGNVDHERFYREVLAPLRSGQPFSYRPYRCDSRTLGEPVPVGRRPINIVEGSYSLHPALADAYDLKVFLSVDPQEQMRRIFARNGEEMARRFASEWIPMEETYFKTFSIAERCDLRFSNG